MRVRISAFVTLTASAIRSAIARGRRTSQNPLNERTQRFPPNTNLDRLEAALRHEQDIFAYPAREWTVSRGNANAPVLDVLIVGGGMAGIATAIGLARERITNAFVVDRNPAAREGLWPPTPACPRCVP